MDYEKKYKEALERAKNLYKDAIDMGENIRAKQCEIIFPELKESEDERIRKEIIDSIKRSMEDMSDSTKVIYNSWLAWLEKQGEKEKFIKKELGCIHSYREEALRRLRELEQQGEKPADMVEQKSY